VPTFRFPTFACFPCLFLSVPIYNGCMQFACYKFPHSFLSSVSLHRGSCQDHFTIPNLWRPFFSQPDDPPPHDSFFCPTHKRGPCPFLHMNSPQCLTFPGASTELTTTSPLPPVQACAPLFSFHRTFPLVQPAFPMQDRCFLSFFYQEERFDVAFPLLLLGGWGPWLLFPPPFGPLVFPCD